MMAESVHQVVEQRRSCPRRAAVGDRGRPAAGAGRGGQYRASGRVLSQRVVVHLPERRALADPPRRARRPTPRSTLGWRANFPSPTTSRSASAFTGGPQRFLTLAAAGHRCDRCRADERRHDRRRRGRARALADRSLARGRGNRRRRADPLSRAGRHPGGWHGAGGRSRPRAGRQPTARGDRATAGRAATSDHNGAAGQRARLPPTLAGPSRRSGQPRAAGCWMQQTTSPRRASP